jgi:hypothetical protein
MSRKYNLILLLIVFPVFAGILLYCYFNYSPPKTIHHGVLLQPPLNMQHFNMFTTDERKWQVAYVPAECCDSVCGKELLQLNQLKKALGENGKKVNLTLIAKQACEVHDSSHIAMEAINMQQVKQFQETLTQAGEATFDMTDKIYVIDPNQNLFVYYLSTTNSNDILNDLRRVLEG